MGLFDETVKKILNENFEKGGFFVFHGTKPKAEEGIKTKGFERFFTKTNGGNMYGAGIYTTYIYSNQGANARGGYGTLMFKAKVKSLKNFVIWDKNVAAKIYGNPSVDYQLQTIFTPEQYNRLKNNTHYNYNEIINTNDSDITSNCALTLCRYLERYDKAAGYLINGFIFKGYTDGYVCYIRDFKNAYPVKISHDCGRTWEDFNGKETLQKYSIDDIDLRWQLGKHNYKLMQELDYVPYFFINNFAKVKKGDKYNFLYRKRSLKDGVISPVWFDFAPETFTRNGTATVIIDNEKYILELEPNTNQFNVYYGDGTYLCKLDALQRVLQRLSQQPNPSPNQPNEDDEDDNF